MKSIKLSLLVLFGTMLITCQKGILNDNIDLTGDWESTEEKLECPCYMLYLKKDTICNFLGPWKKQIRIFTVNDSLFYQLIDIDYPDAPILNMLLKDRRFKRGEKLMFFKNKVFDPFNTPPRFASTEGTIVNENLINYKIYYYDDVTKTGTYGLIRYTGVQEVNLRRIKKK